MECFSWLHNNTAACVRPHTSPQVWLPKGPTCGLVQHRSWLEFIRPPLGHNDWRLRIVCFILMRANAEFHLAPGRQGPALKAVTSPTSCPFWAQVQFLTLATCRFKSRGMKGDLKELYKIMNGTENIGLEENLWTGIRGSWRL